MTTRPKRAPAAPEPATSAPRQPVRVPKLAELVVRHLRNDIISGDLKDQANLPTEAALCQRFGVSRATLREAVRVLETEGLLDTRRGMRGGARLLEPSPRIAARHTGLLLCLRGATVGDVYDARIAIEPYAARLLAETATAEIIAELKLLLVAEQREFQDLAAWGRAAGAFHEAVVALCGNHTLAVLHAQIHEIIEGQIATEMACAADATEAGQYQEVDRTHERLIELVERRDGERAESLWRAHLEAARPWHPTTQSISVEDLMN